VLSPVIAFVSFVAFVVGPVVVALRGNPSRAVSRPGAYGRRELAFVAFVTFVVEPVVVTPS
jgi:hypothetical protein